MKTHLILLSFFGVCFSTVAQISPESYWKDSVLANLKTKPNLQFRVTDSYTNGTDSDTTYYDINPCRIVGWKSNRFIMSVSDDSLKLVDYTTENLTCGSRYPDKMSQDIYGNTYDMYRQYRNRYLKAIPYAWYYFFPKKRDTLFTTCFHSIKDTFFANVSYKELELDYLGGYTRKNSKEDWSPYYDTVKLYVNCNTRLVEKMTVTSSKDPGNVHCYSFSDIRAESQGVGLDSLFDFHHPRYKEYVQCDFLTDFNCAAVENIMLDDSVKQVQLYNTEKETVLLDASNGWILLDFWFTSCGYCRLFHQQLKKEQDSLGYRILEKNGIRLYCINYKSGMTETVRNYAKGLCISDIVYSSRHISRHIAIPYSPYYYLFSPSGELVYRGTMNYKCLLEAKREYEKHPKKQAWRTVECENTSF